MGLLKNISCSINVVVKRHESHSLVPEHGDYANKDKQESGASPAGVLERGSKMGRLWNHEKCVSLSDLQALHVKQLVRGVRNISVSGRGPKVALGWVNTSRSGFRGRIEQVALLFLSLCEKKTQTAHILIHRTLKPVLYKKRFIRNGTRGLVFFFYYYQSSL